MKVGDVVREVAGERRFVVVTDCPNDAGFPDAEVLTWGWYFEGNGQWGGPWHNGVYGNDVFEPVPLEEADRVLANFIAWRLSQ